MDTNSDRMAADAQSASVEVADACAESLPEQLAAAQRRAERAEQRAVAEAQARQAADRARQAAEQILHLAELKNQKLTLELAYYKRLKYAAGSEHYKGEQMELFELDVVADLAAIEAELATPPAQRRRRANAGRRPLPPELPRTESRHEPDSCTCGQCGGALTLIREEVTEQLDIVPGRFFVRRHIRPQYACRHCETVTAEPAPPAVIDGGLPTARLRAWLMIQKYLYHLPLYRLETMTRGYGLAIPRPTMAGWVGEVGVALQPLVDQMAELLRKRQVLHADETPVVRPGSRPSNRLIREIVVKPVVLPTVAYWSMRAWQRAGVKRPGQRFQPKSRVRTVRGRQALQALGGQETRLDGKVRISELLINVVISNKPKMLAA